MSSETTNLVNLAAPISGLSKLFTGLGNVAKSLYGSLQMAQMATALNRLSDTQLEEIGISRSEILSYAQTLVNGESAK